MRDWASVLVVSKVEYSLSSCKDVEFSSPHGPESETWEEVVADSRSRTMFIGANEYKLGILLFEIFGIDFITILYRKIDNGLICYGQDDVFTGRPVST